ncbi:uncharacterized protein L201_005483 [Kwoniella dendrophila CBS 6074]|uniref:Chromosome transmission fidelity protein 8 n=1 Tax=Kwoniella dendrophila CBS 6074 TaxID=1295534 RepID=A0AAX4JZ52_9TREE
MRIHLQIHPSQFESQASSSSLSPLIQLGGDLVLVELQGELSYEGEKSDGVVGLIGLDRPDKPTLHLGQHHLLHGKFVNLQKPYAVIRKSIGTGDSETEQKDGESKLEGNLINEENEDEEEESESSSSSEEEDLFEKKEDPITPQKRRKSQDLSSSPIGYGNNEPLTPIDYSSELEFDPSSPPQSEFSSPISNNKDKVEEEEEEEERPNKRIRNTTHLEGKNKKYNEKINKREKRKKEKQKRIEKGLEKQRIRSYQVVGIVKRKLVFALRPEPLVAPTILPE